MLTHEEKDEIRELFLRIDRIHKEAKARPSGFVCSICGCGDYQAKHAVLKVKRVVHGYEHRPKDSPRLCFKHFGGWAHSFNSFALVRERCDSEIDLHFALYVAKQIMKEKQNACNYT